MVGTIRQFILILCFTFFYLSGSAQFPSSEYYDYFPGFEKILATNSQLEQMYRKSTFEGMSRKVRYRNTISALDRLKYRYRGKPEYDLLFIELVRLCDEYRAASGFDSRITITSPHNPMKYWIELERYYRSRNNSEKLDWLKEWQMERHLSFQNNELFFLMSEESKFRYIDGVFNNDYSEYVQLLVDKYSTNADYLGELFNYQISFKGAIQMREIRMNRVAEKHPSKDVQNLYLLYRKNLDSLQEQRHVLSQSWLDTKQNEVQFQETALYFVTETGQALEAFESHGASLGEKKLESIFQSNTKTWKDVQANLKKGEAFVDILRYKRRTQNNSIIPAYIGLILYNTGYPELIEIAEGDSIENEAFRFYRNSIQYQLDDSNSFNIYWEKIGMTLKNKGIKKVYFSKDGIYHSISPETLRDPNSGQFLLDKYEFHYLLSPRDLLDLSVGKIDFEKDQSLSLVGYPKYKLNEPKFTPVGEESIKISYQADNITRFFKDGQISELPGTRDEVNAISKIWENSGVRLIQYLGVDASENNVRNVRSKVVHIATHGYFNDQLGIEPDINPLLLSGLLFAGSQGSIENLEELVVDPNDGILTAYEALSLNLSGTDLVVLSACETGLGKVRSGQGVMGFQRSLIQAGSKNLIMTLWKVDDQATQRFMTYFYSYLQENQDIPMAFQKARKTLKKEYSVPYYWGAFVLIRS